MKVLFISHEASRSGAPLTLLHIINYIYTNCPDIHFDILLLHGGELYNDFKRFGRVYKAWTDYNIFNRILRKVLKNKVDYPELYFFKKKQFDCIYANSVVSFKRACNLSRKIHVPVVGHVHEAEYLMYEKDVSSKDLLFIKHFITVSTLAKSNLINNYKIPSQDISIQHPVSNWVEKYIKGEYKIKPTHDINKNDFIVGICANEGWCKAVELLPLILLTLNKRHIDFSRIKFVILGITSDLFQYKINRELRKIGIEGKVNFAGHVNCPLDYFSRFDLLLLMSREESFSLSAQEAALMYTPIVGFLGATGAEEWITGGAGILVPYMDINKLADAISYYYTHENERKRTSKNAHDLVVKMYEKDRTIPTVLQVIGSFDNS